MSNINFIDFLYPGALHDVFINHIIKMLDSASKISLSVSIFNKIPEDITLKTAILAASYNINFFNVFVDCYITGLPRNYYFEHYIDGHSKYESTYCKCMYDAKIMSKVSNLKILLTWANLTRTSSQVNMSNIIDGLNTKDDFYHHSYFVDHNTKKSNKRQRRLQRIYGIILSGNLTTNSDNLKYVFSNLFRTVGYRDIIISFIILSGYIIPDLVSQKIESIWGSYPCTMYRIFRCDNELRKNFNSVYYILYMMKYTGYKDYVISFMANFFKDVDPKLRSYYLELYKDYASSILSTDDVDRLFTFK